MDILIKTCLMPLALKTQNDSFIFVHELKQEMHADLKYVESLEKEINELEYDKAEFSNMYDMILQECVSNEVMRTYLLLLSDLDALAELQCLYLHKVKECDCLAQKLSKQTESVSKEVHTELLRRFAKLEKHLISFEIALQKSLELMLLKTSKIYSKGLLLLVKDILLLTLSSQTKFSLSGFGSYPRLLTHYSSLRDKDLQESKDPQVVILNGDSHIPTRVIDGVVQPVTPTTAEQRLARKNELKARVSVVASFSVASAKVLVSALPNVDTLSDAVIYSFFTSQSNSPQLDNKDLKRQEGIWELMELLQLGLICKRLSATTTIEEGTLQESAAMTRAFRQKKNRPTMPSWHLSPQVLPVLIMRDNALVELKKKFEKAKQERDDLKLKLEKFQTSSKNLSQLLVSETNDKTRLGYDNQVFNSFVFNCDEMFSSESDVSMHASPIYDRPSAPLIEDWVSDSDDESEVEHPIPAANLKITIPRPKGYGNRRNRKSCFVCKSLTYLIKDCDCYEKKMVQTPTRNHAQRGNNQQYARMTHPNPYRHVVPTAVLTRSKLVPLTAARLVTIVIPNNNMIRPRPAKTVGTKPHSPPRKTINHRPSPPASNFPPKVTTVKAPKLMLLRKYMMDMLPLVEIQRVKRSQVKVKSGQAKAGNTACYVQNRVLVTKPRNKTLFELLLGRTPSIGFMRPFACPVTILNTLDPLGNQPNPNAGIQKQFDAEKAGKENVQQYVFFPLWSSGSKDPQNTDDDATFEVKEPEFEGKKPESEVHVSLSSSAKTKMHNDKTKREAKGKSPVELSIGFRNLSEEFKDFSDNRINEFNAASTPVPAVGQILTNSTNTFSAAGPSITTVTKSSMKLLERTLHVTNVSSAG
nr:retrovirus-related Pol polyprotein from transposon TNT 1-94 [Tanacetum cinerariifolium]